MCKHSGSQNGTYIENGHTYTGVIVIRSATAEHIILIKI